MTGKRHTLITTLLLIVGIVASAQAQTGAAPAPAPGKLVVTASNQTAATEAETGKARPDEKARPGDVIVYALAFTNQTKTRVSGVTFTNPIPEGLAYIANSASSSRADVRIEYSADGESFSAQPMEEVVIDGRSVLRAVDPSRYTHVKWTVEGAVEAGATVSAEFHGRVATVSRTPVQGS